MPYELKEKRHLNFGSQAHEDNPRWKGKDASYTAKHQWLTRNYGSPEKCDHCGDLGNKGKGGRWSIHYALKQGCSHAHKRENYLGLCQHCHGIYDWNENKTQNMIKAARKQKGTHSLAKSLIAKNRKRQNGRFVALHPLSASEKGK